MTDILKAALWYARYAGWHVLPLHSPVNGVCSCGRRDCSKPAKHPRTSNGVKDATRDPAVITDWWRRWPDANVGIAAGRVSNLVVLDVDYPQGGVDSYKALVSKHGYMTVTVAVLTANGRHGYFQHPNAEIKNSVGMLGPGLDIRADAGYVVAPPSVHISGKAYAWDKGKNPAEAKPGTMPSWLVAKLTEKRNGARGDNDWAELLSRDVPEGQRNDSAAKLAGYLLHYQHSQDVVLALIECWNHLRCKPPLPSRELDAVVASVARTDGR